MFETSKVEEPNFEGTYGGRMTGGKVHRLVPLVGALHVLCLAVNLDGYSAWWTSLPNSRCWGGVGIIMEGIRRYLGR